MNKTFVTACNQKLGFKTNFFFEPNGIYGYTENGVVHINAFYQDEIEKINKHEVLHHYENSDTFKIAKKVIISSFTESELDELENEYFLRYGGLYDIENEIDIIHTEIAIDVIAGDESLPLRVREIAKEYYSIITNSEKPHPSRKRFLNLTTTSQIKQQFKDASLWEKLFVLHCKEQGKNLKIGRDSKYQDLKKEINLALETLYSYAENNEYFKIFYMKNSEIHRQVDNQIKAMRARGEKKAANYYKENLSEAWKMCAKKHERRQQAEFKHICDFLKTANYDPAFKYLILNETLTKFYKQQKKDGKIENIVKSREKNRSLARHMTLTENVLDYIYSNAKDYSNFTQLYFDALSNSNKITTQDFNIDYNNIDTLNIEK